MLYYLEGRLMLPAPSTAVIDCGGMGFGLTITASTLQKLAGKEGQKVKLLTYMDIKEGSVELIGFYTEEELFAFRQLITVSGVGPKAAVAILSALTPEKLAQAVANGNVKAITAANGVGKKIAERVILELRDKLPTAGSADGEMPGSDSAEVMIASSDDAADALNALLMLGYTKAEAGAAIKRVDPIGKPFDEIVRQALRVLRKQ